MKKLLAIILTSVLIFSGCAEFLDVNQSPNNLDVESATEKLVFPAAVENTAAVIGTYVLFLGEFWSHHWTSAPQAPSYQTEDSYQVSAGEYDYDLGTWRNIYTGALMDYEVVRKKALEKKNWTYYLMATVMQCYVYHILADLWDNIPLSDALKSKPPKYDKGPQVYDTLIARIDFALSRDLTASTCEKPGNVDLVFGGDMNKWIAFANTLKLKIYLRQIYARPQVINQIQALINSGAQFLTYSDAAVTYFIDQSGKDNYVYAREWRGGNINIRASKTLLEYLKAKNDERYKFIFTPTSSGSYQGMYQGDFRNQISYPDNQKPSLSSPRITPTMPFYFMSQAEANFLLSEAYLRLGDKVNSRKFYNDAVAADVNRLKNLFGSQVTGVTLDTANIVGPGKYAFFNVNFTDEQLLELIIVQKWIALANIGGHEAFFEHNRTKYPREYGKIDDNFLQNYNTYIGYFHVSVTGVLPDDSPYPRRLIYPSIEQNKNSANVPAIKQLYEPVWWDVRQHPYPKPY